MEIFRKTVKETKITKTKTEISDEVVEKFKKAIPLIRALLTLKKL